MAELTTLEEKLAEVIGLARAAQVATQKVEGMLDNEELASQLQRQRQEAAETERRGTEVAENRDGKKTAILEKAQDGRRVGHWEILGKLSEKAGEEEIEELVTWALPIQERHLKEAREGSLALAAEEDPTS